MQDIIAELKVWLEKIESRDPSVIGDSQLYVVELMQENLTKFMAGGDTSEDSARDFLRIG